MSTDMFPQGFIDYMVERGPVSEHCRTGCPSKDHATWGECARAARMQIDRAALAAARTDTKGRT